MRERHLRADQFPLVAIARRVGTSLRPGTRPGRAEGEGRPPSSLDGGRGRRSPLSGQRATARGPATERGRHPSADDPVPRAETESLRRLADLVITEAFAIGMQLDGASSLLDAGAAADRVAAARTRLDELVHEVRDRLVEASVGR